MERGLTIAAAMDATNEQDTNNSGCSSASYHYPLSLLQMKMVPATAEAESRSFEKNDPEGKGNFSPSQFQQLTTTDCLDVTCAVLLLQGLSLSLSLSRSL